MIIFHLTLPDVLFLLILAMVLVFLLVSWVVEKVQKLFRKKKPDAMDRS